MILAISILILNFFLSFRLEVSCHFFLGFVTVVLFFVIMFVFFVTGCVLCDCGCCLCDCSCYVKLLKHCSCTCDWGIGLRIENCFSRVCIVVVVSVDVDFLLPYCIGCYFLQGWLFRQISLVDFPEIFLFECFLSCYFDLAYFTLWVNTWDLALLQHISLNLFTEIS